MTIETDTAEFADYALKHFGVKGMKWGVRRAEKKLAKADRKWEKSIYTMRGAVNVHNAVADRMNGPTGYDGEIAKFNNQPKYKGKNLYDDPALEKQYFKEFEAVQTRVYAQAVNDVHGKSPSGRKKAQYVPDEYGGHIEIRDTKVRHAALDGEEPNLIILLKFDDSGFVIEVNGADASAAHADTSYSLTHYGVRGMKWGVHRSAESRAAPSQVKEKIKPARRGAEDIKVVAKAGRVARTSGGRRNVSTADAISAAVARQKAKASSVESLSNAELKKAIERMNMEQQFRDLQKKRGREGGLGKLVVELLLGEPLPGGQNKKKK